MKAMMKNRWSLVAIVMCSLAPGLGAEVSRASVIYDYDLEIVTTTGSYYDDPRLDLYVEVSAEGAGVRFEFHNDSSIDSCIEGIYFDDGSLLGIATIESVAGTSFSQGATPANLPAGQNLVPPFETTQGFSADSDPPVSHNGVNPGEWVAIVFNLVNGSSISDVIDQLNNGTLRIGAHVISLPDGSSESAINVPEPATLLVLIVSGLVAFTARALRRHQITHR